MTILTPSFSPDLWHLSHQGKRVREVLTKVFEPEEDKYTDEWWRSKLLIDGFNEACKTIAASYLKVGDDSMSAIRFPATAKGDLPHLFYISASRSHWGQSSRKSLVLSQGHFYLLNYREEIKE